MSDRQQTRSGDTAEIEHQAAAARDPDAALLARIVEGDAHALHALYVKHYHRLLRFVRRITGQVDIAQEVINDVMLVVWRDGKAFQGRSAVSSWILGIAYRKALKVAAQSRRWSDRFARVDFEEATERFPAPEELNKTAEVQDLLEQGLSRLSAEHRAVVELTYFFGCSYEEISAITGAPVNTVKTRMFYAREKLRKLLPELGRDELR